MPPPESFRDTESYYSVLGHETCHWTKHPSRLDRAWDASAGAMKVYAMEELVAELGAAFLCADLELTPEPRGDHASYLDHWLKVLKVTVARSSPRRRMRNGPAIPAQPAAAWTVEGAA